MSGNSQRGMPEIMTAVLTVKSKTFITPHYVRVVLEGDGINSFARAGLGDNNKIIIPEDKQAVIELPEFGRGGVTGTGARTRMRTYTMRSLDLEKGEMAIDFVSHGDDGIASRWAAHAVPGDQLGVLMKVKGRSLFQPADYYLLIGDHSALAVISVILELLPADTRGKAILEVYSKDDVIELEKPEGVDVVWVFNDEPGKTPLLLHYFEKENLATDGSRFIYVAAEHEVVDEIQHTLRHTEGLQRHEWQAYAYWKYGQTEDHSSEDRVKNMHRG